MNKKLMYIIGVLNCIACGMEKNEHQKKEEIKKVSSSSPRRSIPFISHWVDKARSASPSPDRNSLAELTEENIPRKTSSPTGSPAGSRFASKTIGRRDSKELIGHLKEELSKIEKTEILLTGEEFNQRFERVIKEHNPVIKKRELAQLACAKIKNPSSAFDTEIKRQQALKEFFAMNAHELRITLQNRLVYLNQKNQEEALNQELVCKKIFFEQYDVLLRMIESDDNNKIYHQNRWNAMRTMVPVFVCLEEHLKIEGHPNAEKLEEYQNRIKEEQFLPK